MAKTTAKNVTDPLAPHALAARQRTLDAERTRRFPATAARKAERMRASPLAFLRGAAPLFYEVLATRPELAEGPDGEGWIVGDAHLENFGAYRPDAPDDGRKRGREAVFDLNDFDETVIGPWRLDLVRLATSVLVGGRELGATGPVSLQLVDALLDAWAAAATSDAPRPPAPPSVDTLLRQVRERTREALLDARTEVVRGRRRFVRGPRYADLDAKTRAALPRAFQGYVASLDASDRPDDASFEILDAALRIAGTGSLGALRIAVLAEGKGGKDGAFVFDLKEEGAPSAAALVGAPRMAPAERVAEGYRQCLERPPRLIGTTTLGGVSLFGRRLAPQEDKLALEDVRAEELPVLARHLGALLGAAHRRGATRPPKKRCSASDLAAVRKNAIVLAGLHEGAYLAFCAS